MNMKLVLAALAAILLTACSSRVQEYNDPPCGVKELEAGLCKEPVY